MRTMSSSSDFQPLGSFGRLPIYLTTVLSALYVLGMLVTAVLGASEVSVRGLSFSTHDFFSLGWVWEPLTCSFLNPPDFFFLFGIFFFYSAGLEVERYLGRTRFLKFYILCLGIVPVVLGLWHGLGIPASHAGMGGITIALFVAFATLYPDLQYMGWVPIKYVAGACFAIACLGYVPTRNWTALSIVAAEGAVGFCFVRYLQGGGSLEWNDWKEKIFGPRRNFKVLPPPKNPPRSQPTAPKIQDSPDPVFGSIDPLLEKIARSGLASLTSEEREQLEKARESLLKKDRPKK
jgi:membrane associated rhomboid family serine protease